VVDAGRALAWAIRWWQGNYQDEMVVGERKVREKGEMERAERGRVE